MRVTFLGTGASSGTPVPGCSCAVCCSGSRHDKRLRPAILLEHTGHTLLVDAPPELRLQLLSARVSGIDALFITHCHADHIFGLDDVRIFSRDRKIPVYANRLTLTELKAIFPYVFKRTQKAGGKPRLRLKEVNAPFRLFGLSITPIPVFHGNRRILGFRFNDFAYIPDVNRIPEPSFRLLRNLQVLALDALRDTESPTHFSLSQAIETARRIGARRTWFTHVSHRLDHKTTQSRLPQGVRLAHDGLRLSLFAER